MTEKQHRPQQISDEYSYLLDLTYEQINMSAAVTPRGQGNQDNEMMKIIDIFGKDSNTITWITQTMTF